MRIVVLSDTHGMHRRLSIPEADVLVHCGDLLNQGSLGELAELNLFLGELPHRHKVLIAGNHDWCFERTPREARALLTHAIYLRDESVELEGLTFYGSPWQPWFFDWAFNLERGEPLRKVWARIPEQTDVLITHGPPQGYLDLTARGEPAGCEELRRRIETIRPALHLFGHIHEGYGVARSERTLFVNASNCTVRYEPINPPLVLSNDDGPWALAQA